MSSPNFIDYVKFRSKSGKGGAGCLHFHREKFVPKGGPDGGDGGKGGSVILRGNSQLWTLLHLKFRKHITAKDGASGEGQDRTGADGEDEIIEVPLGTVARDAESGEQLCEINQDGEEFVLTPGGRGGKGNAHFATPTNQAPQHFQPGGPAIEHWVILELKLLADVGLVGFPNAGKSTLLSVVSAARPKIADYAFTTLTPNLGVVAYRDSQSFVMADIPGIIEGASEGKGLGIRFLRHIE
ncbi:MAG: GTPase ObgE, partial [Bacteroidota bacterium]